MRRFPLFFSGGTMDVSGQAAYANIDGVTSIDAGRLRRASAARRWFAVAPIALMSVVVVFWATQLRARLAVELPLQCDEIPLLVRFTSLCGAATTEAEAQVYRPSLFGLRTGAMRSLHVPRFQFAAHTTAGFWSNLTLNLFGYSAGAVRSIQVFWSILAIVGVSWAVWMAGRSAVAACVAALVVALSPFSIAYGSQARGYAEALALAVWFLIALEWLRRKPSGYVRALLVLALGLQLSLTVYTMWVYWVLPVIVLSVWRLPRRAASRDDAVKLRPMLMLIAAGLVGAVGVYTMDRFGQLTTTNALASSTGALWGGADFTKPAELLMFLRRLAWQLIPGSAWLLVLVPIGVWRLRRSECSWWLWAMAAGVGVPFVFALVNGTPGYVRNLGFLLAPAAILVGLGAAVVWQRVSHRLHPIVAGVAWAVILGGTAAMAAPEAAARARAVLRPDWGAVVLRWNQDPPGDGPRWFCPCLANHWQINWYRASHDDDRFFDVPPGGTIEVAMGARRESDGRAIVYRFDAAGGAIREAVMPDYLRRITPFETYAGVELRRWVGTRLTMDKTRLLSPSRPVLVMTLSTAPLNAGRRRHFLSTGGAFERGVVTFKGVSTARGLMQSMIVPARIITDVVSSLQEELGVEPSGVRVFSLTPLRSPLEGHGTGATARRSEAAESSARESADRAGARPTRPARS